MFEQKKSESAYAVVTGASRGLGKAFALELARRKINLILVSLPKQNLFELAKKIVCDFRIKVQYYETDFSKPKNVIELASWINDNFEVSILINNAGIGGTKKFTEAPLEYINTIMQINVVATSILSHQLLPNLMKQKQSYILNVSSMAAFSPIGYKTVYPASKSFIHSFSRGLFQELKNTSVFVSVVNPGAMNTSPEIQSRIEKQDLLGKLTLLNPEKVARYSIQRLFKKDAVIMVNPISWIILQLTPIWIKLPLMTRAIKREI